MRVSREFRPVSTPALEPRVVRSQLGVQEAALQPVKLTPVEIAQSNASENAFGLGVSDKLRAGLSVAEQLTTNYNDGSTQTESLLEVPNLANNTITSYKTINLRNNGGIETIVDTESFSGGILPFSGNDNTHTLTITLPDGSTETETYHEIVTGNKTVVTGTLDKAAGIETWKSIKIKHGSTTTANKTIVEPNFLTKFVDSTTTRHGELDSTTTTKTQIPANDQILHSSSATNVIRVQPPSS
jgi:hypothetical protein